MFEYISTIDKSPYLCVPASLRFRQNICGGEEAIMDYCSSIGRAGAKLIASELGTEVMEQEGSESCALWNVRLPICSKDTKEIGVVRVNAEHARKVTDFMTQEMMDEYGTFIAIISNYKGWWWARLSGQIYLELSDFEFGAKVLRDLTERVRKGEYLN
jgi:hercynylcysteine S-oxide lyase